MTPRERTMAIEALVRAKEGILRPIECVGRGSKYTEGFIEGVRRSKLSIDREINRIERWGRW